MGEEKLNKYKKTDGSMDWGKHAIDQLLVINNQPLKKTAKLEDLSVFKLADKISDDIWKLVSKWDYFAKKTVGDQIIRSADSVAANITEGYGRYFFGENILFLYYARGSAYETIFWLEKAHKRELIDDQQYKDLKSKLDKLPLEINKVVKIIKSQAKKWKGRPKY